MNWSTARLVFDLTQNFELPDGFDIEDLVDAQVLIGFKRDSTDWDDVDYADNDTDTGIITIHQMTTATSDLFNQTYFAAAPLGLYDPPPHIIPDPPSPIRGVPMPLGTPVSFGHNDRTARSGGGLDRPDDEL